MGRQKMVNTSLDKLSTENAEINLVWTENILNMKPFGKNDNLTINMWLILGVAWGALKRRRHLLTYFIFIYTR